MNLASAKSPVTKIVVACSFIGFIIYLISSGSYDPQVFVQGRDYIQGQELYGPLLYIAAFALLQPVGFGSHGFIFAAAFLWPPYQGFLYALTGATAAAIVAFYFSRYVGYEWVQARLPAKLRNYEQRLVDHQFRTMLVMRLLFFTFAPMQFMFGVSRVGFPKYLLTTILGITPLIAIETWLGSSVFHWLLDQL